MREIEVDEGDAVLAAMLRQTEGTPEEVVARSVARTLRVGEKADEYRERWDPEQRYRLYVRRAGMAMSDRREVMAVETSGLIGPMIELARGEGEFGPHDRSAVLDTAPWEFGYPGEWIVGSLA